MGFLILFLAVIGSTLITIKALDFSQCFLTENVCPNENITFWLYTRETQNSPQQITLNDLGSAKFIKDRPLIFIIHGYTGFRDFAPNPELRPAYFENGEYNLISLDYGPLARSPCYAQAVLNARVVGQCIAQLIDRIIELQLFTFNDIKVVGFSLGGQVAGIIATYLTSGRLQYIVGLDPAKPLFITAPNMYKLDVLDADFVEVIHCDVLGRGVLQPAGHVDFYMNGGVEQPGCRVEEPTSTGSCNHNRAPKYFAEAINSRVGFYGRRCAHWYLFALGICMLDKQNEKAIMGPETPTSTRGLYFISTNSKSPYALGPNDDESGSYGSRNPFL